MALWHAGTGAPGSASRIRTSIVGTTLVRLTPSSPIRSRKPFESNFPATDTAERARSERVKTEKPPMRAGEIGICQRSPRPKGRFAAEESALAKRAWRVKTAGLGRPAVPDVKTTTAASSGKGERTASAFARRSPSSVCVSAGWRSISGIPASSAA